MREWTLNCHRQDQTVRPAWLANAWWPPATGTLLANSSPLELCMRLPWFRPRTHLQLSLNSPSLRSRERPLARVRHRGRLSPAGSLPLEPAQGRRVWTHQAARGVTGRFHAPARTRLLRRSGGQARQPPRQRHLPDLQRPPRPQRATGREHPCRAHPPRFRAMRAGLICPPKPRRWPR